MFLESDKCLDRRLDKDAKQSSEYITDAAGQERAADNRGSYRIHLEALCLLNEAAQRIQTEKDTADAAKETVRI